MGGQAACALCARMRMCRVFAQDAVCVGWAVWVTPASLVVW